MILFFSGTGNSRFVAKCIAEETGDKLVDTKEYIREGKSVVFSEDDTFIFISPVYVSAPPIIFLNFIKRSQFPKYSKAYFIMTCAGGMGGAPGYCRQLALEKELTYMGTAEIMMPQNYIALFKIKTSEENRLVIQKAITELKKLVETIKLSDPFPNPHMKSWEFLSTRMILDLYYKCFISAKKFTVTNKCISCGKCTVECPMKNIEIHNGKPTWGTHCTHCMACINLCPKEAVEYGKRTLKKNRYHGPDILC